MTLCVEVVDLEALEFRRCTWIHLGEMERLHHRPLLQAAVKKQRIEARK